MVNVWSRDPITHDEEEETNFANKVLAINCKAQYFRYSVCRPHACIFEVCNYVRICVSVCIIVVLVRVHVACIIVPTWKVLGLMDGTIFLLRAPSDFEHPSR